MCDFIYNWWFIYKNVIYDGDGRKKTRNAKEKTNNKETITRLVALPSPRLRNGGRLFSGVWKHQKQAGPTLSGRGILI